MSVVEPLGVRILGIEFKESHLEATAKAVLDTPYLAKKTLGSIAEGAIKFCEFIQEDEKFLTETNPEVLREIFERSGLTEHKYFFVRFLDNLSKKKSLVNLISSLGSVTTESGSLRIKFRNYLKEIEELKVDIKKLWRRIEEQKVKIINSFKHLAEFAENRLGEAKDRIVHIGLYGAAFGLIILSLWFSAAFGVISGLSTLASNLFRNLKAAWPIISYILFILCLIYEAMEFSEKLSDARDAVSRILG